MDCLGFLHIDYLRFIGARKKSDWQNVRKTYVFSKTRFEGVKLKKKKITNVRTRKIVWKNSRKYFLTLPAGIRNEEVWAKIICKLFYFVNFVKLCFLGLMKLNFLSLNECRFCIHLWIVVILCDGVWWRTEGVEKKKSMKCSKCILLVGYRVKKQCCKSHILDWVMFLCADLSVGFLLCAVFTKLTWIYRIFIIHWFDGRWWYGGW